MDLVNLFSSSVKPIVASKLGFKLQAIEVDPSDEPAVLDNELGEISGLALLIEYTAADGIVSQRLVTCRKISDRVGGRYLSAYCHHRRALRTFRLDRIVGVFDPKTGEFMGEPQGYLSRFSSNEISNSALNWGISPSRRADLIAILTCLIFIARCDQDYHSLERDALEAIATRFWLRLEIPSDPDLDDILSYADRLAPDGEAFWLSIQRIRSNHDLVPLFKQALRQIIEADGFQHQSEFYWASQVQEFFG